MNKNMSTDSDNQYLTGLLGKYKSKMDQTQQYINAATDGYEQLIKNGKYQIKSGSPIARKIQPSSPNRSSINKMNKMKKDYENKLNFVDSQIHEMSNQEEVKKMKEDQRAKFMAEMRKAHKLMEAKRERELKKVKVKNSEEQKKEEEELLRRQEEIKQKRRQEIAKRNSEKETLKKKHEKEIESQNEELKQKMKEKILSDQLIQNYQKYEVKNLEERKKKLAEIRSLHKPLSKDEFEQHLQKIQQWREKVPKPKSQLITSRYANTDNKEFYQSAWYQKEREKKREYENQRHEEQLYQMKEARDKLNKYSQYVKQNYKPEVSEKMRRQMEVRSKSMLIGKKSEQEGRSLGLKYLEYSKEQGDPSKSTEQHEEIKKAFRYMNYLEEIKKSHEEESKNNHDFLEKIKNKKNLSTPEKTDRILKHIDELERKAKLKEEKKKANQNAVDEELDELYMEAVSAKLTVLLSN